MVAEFGLVTRREAKLRKKSSGEAWLGGARKREVKDENLEPCDKEARHGSEKKQENETWKCVACEIQWREKCRTSSWRNLAA